MDDVIDEEKVSEEVSAVCAIKLGLRAAKSSLSPYGTKGYLVNFFSDFSLLHAAVKN